MDIEPSGSLYAPKSSRTSNMIIGQTDPENINKFSRQH